MTDHDEEKEPFVRIGFFGTMGEVDPIEVWSDPADPESDDAAELVRLLQERRIVKQQGSCSIPGMPGVEPVQE